MITNIESWWEMLTINWKQVYEVDINGSKKWILILYNISKNHYVGLPVYSEEIENSIFIKSINKYAVLSEISDYNRASIKRCIYLKGKILKITKKEMDKIFLKSKDYFLDYVKNNTNNDSDGIAYNKWCKEKIELINKKDKNITIYTIFYTRNSKRLFNIYRWTNTNKTCCIFINFYICKISIYNYIHICRSKYN